MIDAAESREQELEALLAKRTHELSFAQGQIDSLFRNSTLAIGTADLDGRVLTANDAMKMMFGYPGEEIFRANVADFFQDKAFREAAVKSLIRDRYVRVPKLQLKRKDGTTFYANLTESILEREGQSVMLGIVDDITDQMIAEQLLREKAEAEAIAAERNRLARELHDSVTQTLYSASLIAEALPNVWQSHPQEALRSLEELRVLTRGALAEMRTLLLELKPGELADRKLGELLRQLIDATSASAELPISLTVAGDYQLPTDVQVALYRIAQEAINNIKKHARASHAWVNLKCDRDRLTLRIRDNGRGLDMTNTQAHQLGRQIMRERAEAIGAELTIESQPGQGTEVRVIWQANEDE